MSKKYTCNSSVLKSLLLLAALFLAGFLLLPTSRASMQVLTDSKTNDFITESESVSLFTESLAAFGLGVWTRNGPINVRFTDGRYSLINDRAITVASGNANIVYAGSNGDGVYKTTNGGTTWTNVSNGFPVDSQGRPDVDVDVLESSLSNNNILYAAPYSEFWRSSNGGASWTSVYVSGIPSVSRFVQTIAIHPTNPNLVYVGVAGVDSGIYVSSNGGANWSPLGTGLPSSSVYDIAINPNNPSVMYAACVANNQFDGRGIYKSTNAGANWTAINTGLPVNAGISEIQISPQNSNILYVGLTNNAANGTSHVYRSDNAGATWSAAGNGLGVSAHVLDIAVSAVNSNVVYAAAYAGGVYKTTDGGQNWTAFNNGLTTSSAKGLALSSDGLQLHLGTGGGVWNFTENGTSGCTYGLSPSSPQSVPATGGSNSISVNAAAGCTWTAVSNAPWITVTGGASGSGNGTVSYNAAANTGAARSGTITIAGQNFTVNQAAATQAVRRQFDFDGDGKADLSVFRPSNGGWYIYNLANGTNSSYAFGLSTDKITPADYDGDGKTDVAVFRDGTWYLNRSQAGFTGVGFGAASDIPVPADFDGDGKAELCVFRPANGGWYIYNLATNQSSSFAFGQTGDKAVPADYDGDGKADLAVYRNGTWYIQRSQSGFTGIGFGDANDKAVPADYDGDGKTDIAVFRPSTGGWYLLQSTAGFTAIGFGIGTDLPVAADYDGDGKADLAVFRSGTWYIQRTTAGFTGAAFGTAGDKPVPSAFVP